MGLSEVEWELDSDEIASATSEDLHNNRPNRWTSPKSTWRELTQEERRLWQAMRQLQDQDLAAHLYNAFALRRRGKDPDTKQDLVIKTVSFSPSLQPLSGPDKSLKGKGARKVWSKS